MDGALAQGRRIEQGLCVIVLEQLDKGASVVVAVVNALSIMLIMK